MSTTVLMPCPFPGCNAFPYDRVEELSAHLREHAGDTPAPVPVPTTPSARGQLVATSASGRFATVTNGFGGTTTVKVTPTRPTVELTGDTAADLAAAKDFLVNLGRKIEVNEVTTELAKVAETWAASYTGTFEFAAEMKQTMLTKGRLTDGQAKGTLNCIRAEALREASRKTASPAADFTGIPEGRYAFTADEGHTAFAKVDHGKGRWDGRTFVTLLVGAPGHFREIKTSKATAEAILTKIALDPKAASIRFGHEVGACGRCGSPLTDPDSIAAGIGPVCAGKGW